MNHALAYPVTDSATDSLTQPLTHAPHTHTHSLTLLGRAFVYLTTGVSSSLLDTSS